MRILARIFSNVLHPLLMATYGTILSIYFSLLLLYPNSLKWYLVIVVAVCTLLLPSLIISILYLLKIISSVALVKRKERPIPYVLSILCYIFCCYLLWRLKMPMWFISFFIGATVALLTAFIITFWWKISAHMTGIGGFLAASFYIMSHFHIMSVYWFMLFVLLTGAVGSSRIYLGRHTLMQVLCGTANGFLWVYLAMNIL